MNHCQCSFTALQPNELLDVIWQGCYISQRSIDNASGFFVWHTLRTSVVFPTGHFLNQHSLAETVVLLFDANRFCFASIGHFDIEGMAKVDTCLNCFTSLCNVK